MIPQDIISITEPATVVTATTSPVLTAAAFVSTGFTSGAGVGALTSYVIVMLPPSVNVTVSL